MRDDLPSPHSRPVAPALGVYIHWPFCARLCPYCDFNIYKDRAVDEAAWLAAFKKELRTGYDLRGDGAVGSVFFGGGTPSLMSMHLISGVLETIHELWGLARDAEISVEMNPEHVRPAYLTALRDAGVNRISLGVQALTEDGLRFLGRQHDVPMARQAIENVAHVFENYNLDFIYARADQTVTAWQDELVDILALAPPHLSLYELTIEPNTAFGFRARRGDIMVLADEPRAQMYDVCQDLCAAHGLPAYEVSNYARPDDACRHNVATWRGGDYLGVGPGAHGRVTIQNEEALLRYFGNEGVSVADASGVAGGLSGRWATCGQFGPQDWLDAVAQNGHGWSAPEHLDATMMAQEYVLLGMRLIAGIPYDPSVLPDQGTLSGQIASVMNGDQLAQLCADGYLQLDHNRLQTTRRGRLVLDHILGALLS